MNNPGAAQIVDLILSRLNEVGLSRNFHVLNFLCHVVYRKLIKINIDDFFIPFPHIYLPALYISISILFDFWTQISEL